MPEKKKRGGNHLHPKDCKCGKCPQRGRPKATRPTDGNMARKLKQRAHAEELWMLAVTKAAQKAKDTGNTADLVRILEYWDNRDLGMCVDTVNHLHDKPLEVNATVSIRGTLEKALQRALKR